MTVRLIFAFLFQWTVSAAGRVLAWIIPDRPRSLDLKIKRQEFLAKEALRNYKIKTGKRKPEKEVVDVSDEEEDTVDATDELINDNTKGKRKKSAGRSNSGTTTTTTTTKARGVNSLNQRSSSLLKETRIDIKLNGQDRAKSCDGDIRGELANETAEDHKIELQTRPSSWNGNANTNNKSSLEMQDLKDDGGGNASNLPTTSPKYSFDYLTQML